MFGVTFDDPYLLLLLLLLIPTAVWIFHRRRRPGTIRYSDVSAMRALKRPLLSRLFRLPDVLRLCGLAVLIVAAARPQTADYEVLTGKGVDIVLALDMSGSMNAVDMPEDQLAAVVNNGETPKNRFEIARDTIEAFVHNRTQDRVGLVVFGQQAFLKFPLTLDYGRILRILRGLVLDNAERDGRSDTCTNQCTISGAGTAIGDALARSYQRLRDSKAKSKVIVLITDGTNEGGNIQPNTIVDYIAQRPSEEQVRIYTFLVGDDKNTFLPTRTVFGDLTYQRAARPFPTNPELLQEIADKTGGKYFESYNEEKFREDFQKLEQTVFQTTVRNQQKDIFMGFVWVGACILLFETLLRTSVFRKFP
ncbi:MAG: VWA domain-containing protein [Myxococcales bacterium]|nr:VWA domain-containing protein [Myxococcales bacterium]